MLAADWMFCSNLASLDLNNWFCFLSNNFWSLFWFCFSKSVSFFIALWDKFLFFLSAFISVICFKSDIAESFSKLVKVFTVSCILKFIIFIFLSKSLISSLTIGLLISLLSSFNSFICAIILAFSFCCFIGVNLSASNEGVNVCTTGIPPPTKDEIKKLSKTRSKTIWPSKLPSSSTNLFKRSS